MPQQLDLLPPVKKGVVHIVRDECLMTLVPSPPGIEKVLTYTEKAIVEDKRPGESFSRGRKLTRFKVYLYTILGEQPRMLQTYAGLLDKVIQFCVKEGYPFRLFDDRPVFPKPKLHLMIGERFSQKRLTTAFLLKDRSGIFCAPTRYGKSSCIKNVLRAYPGITWVVIIPGKDLLQQGFEDIRDGLPTRDVKMLGGGSKNRYPSEDITVCSMDSLHLCDPGRVRGVIVDEPHAVVTNERAKELVKFSMARKFGFGATPKGRFDGRDLLLEGLIGPALVTHTYREAVAEGAICPLIVYMVKVKFSNYFVTNRDRAYKEMLFESERMAKVTSKLCKELLPPDWQTIVFIKNEKQADLFLSELGDGTIAMAKTMTNKVRKETMARMQSAEITRCLSSNIYATGTTFHNIRAIINAEGGGGNILAIQKPGRLAEIRPGKKYGYIFDFLFECEGVDHQDADSSWRDVVRDCHARMDCYKEKGYDVRVMNTWGQLQDDFQKTEQL